jgi:hypothetical protein
MVAVEVDRYRRSGCADERDEVVLDEPFPAYSECELEPPPDAPQQ